MTTIGEFKVNGYRMFGANGNPLLVKLAPITLITGPNGSGKSSLLNVLEVLWTTFSAHDTVGEGGDETYLRTVCSKHMSGSFEISVPVVGTLTGFHLGRALKEMEIVLEAYYLGKLAECGLDVTTNSPNRHLFIEEWFKRRDDPKELVPGVKALKLYADIVSADEGHSQSQLGSVAGELFLEVSAQSPRDVIRALFGVKTSWEAYKMLPDHTPPDSQNLFNMLCSSPLDEDDRCFCADMIYERYFTRSGRLRRGADVDDLVNAPSYEIRGRYTASGNGVELESIGYYPVIEDAPSDMVSKGYLESDIFTIYPKKSYISVSHRLVCNMMYPELNQVIGNSEWAAYAGGMSSGNATLYWPYPDKDDRIHISKISNCISLRRASSELHASRHKVKKLGDETLSDGPPVQEYLDVTDDYADLLWDKGLTTLLLYETTLANGREDLVARLGLDMEDDDDVRKEHEWRRCLASRYMSIADYCRQRKRVYRIPAVRTAHLDALLHDTLPPVVSMAMEYYSEHADESDRSWIRMWLDELGLGSDIAMERIQGFGYRPNVVLMSGETCRYGELAFGTSQAIPVLMLLSYILDSGEKDVEYAVIVEEPESHLHPKVQSRMADVFVDFQRIAQKRGVRVVLLIETHSEYIIRRMQYQVASGLCSSDTVAIQYLSDVPEDGDYGTIITIDDKGSLSSRFGRGFYDESANQIGQLWSLGGDAKQ